MTVNTTTINGFIVLPDDTVREKSSVIFTMTGFDTDADDNATVVPIPREAPIAVDGSIDIDLWPNPEGVRSTFYRVTFSIYNGNKPYLVDGGLIEVPVTDGPYDLNDLLPIAPPQGATVEEYIAQLAASIAAAENAADRAEAAAGGLVGPFATRAAFVTWAAGNTADDGVIASDGTVQYVASAGATAVSDLPGWLPYLSNGIAHLSHWGVDGEGLVDNLAKVENALASGYPLSGKGLALIGVSGKLELSDGDSLWDATFKQLAPGASLGVRTINADNADNLNLRRVRVDRNGDGTNGGLLEASGVNGALNTAFGIRINGGTGHDLRDLEVWGDDSGTGILLQGLDHTSKVTRVFAHDIRWVRTTASDDMVQGVWVYQCEGLKATKLRGEDLTGVLNGTPVQRYTRGIAGGGNRFVELERPIVNHVDQGIDMSGDEGNNDCTISFGYVRDAATWGFKWANSARRSKTVFCVADKCGVGFVASGNASLASGIRTRQVSFIDCLAKDSGALENLTGGPSAGFRILGDTDAAAATDCRWIRCRAIDTQAVATMAYGFMSETSLTSDSMPFAKDCEVAGATTGDFQGNMRRPRYGSNANGEFVIDDFGSMLCWHRIDAAAESITTAVGSTGFFRTVGSVSWTYPMAFVEIDTVIGNVERSASGIVSFLHIDQRGLTSAELVPSFSASIGSGNAKFINVHAKGQAW